MDELQATHRLLGGAGARKLKCHVQCTAVAMLVQTVVTNRSTVAVNPAEDEVYDV